MKTEMLSCARGYWGNGEVKKGGRESLVECVCVRERGRESGTDELIASSNTVSTVSKVKFLWVFLRKTRPDAIDHVKWRFN